MLPSWAFAYGSPWWVGIFGVIVGFSAVGVAYVRYRLTLRRDERRWAELFARHNEHLRQEHRRRQHDDVGPDA